MNPYMPADHQDEMENSLEDGEENEPLDLEGLEKQEVKKEEPFNFEDHEYV